MKIAFFVYDLGGGGAERAFSLLAGAFAKEHDVMLLTVMDHATYEFTGQTIVLCPGSKPRGLQRWIQYGSWILKLRKVVREHQPDVVISFSILCNFLASLSGGRVVFMAQNNWLEMSLPRRVLARLTYPKGSLVCVSKLLSEQAERHFGFREVQTIYNPVDVAQVTAALDDPSKMWLGEYKFLITAGRLVEQKSQQNLIRIYHEIRKRHPSLKFVMLGEGPLRESLNKLAQALGLRVGTKLDALTMQETDVIMPGFVDEPFSVIRCAQCFVLGSRWEGLPLVLLEAMACGVPVISSDCPTGPREVLSPESDLNQQAVEPEFGPYGVLMPVFEDEPSFESRTTTDTEVQWVQTISDFLNSPARIKQLADTSRERVVDFDVESIARQWIAYLESRPSGKARL